MISGQGTFLKKEMKIKKFINAIFLILYISSLQSPEYFCEKLIILRF